MFALLSVNGYILSCVCTILLAVSVYFWIVNFPKHQEVTQDEIDRAKAIYEEIKQVQSNQEKTVEVVIINGHGKAVKVTLSQEGWEAYKEDRRLHREQMSYQSLN